MEVEFCSLWDEEFGLVVESGLFVEVFGVLVDNGGGSFDSCVLEILVGDVSEDCVGGAAEGSGGGGDGGGEEDSTAIFIRLVEPCSR